ncbi:MAG TPA: sugar transferase [Polyangiaceae bacterium]
MAEVRGIANGAVDAQGQSGASAMGGPNLGRRAADIFIGFCVALILLPAFALIAVLVLAADGRPVLFVQERVGRYGELFKVIKFRTMRCVPCGTSITLAGDPRITTLGRFLRATHLDELPQFLNVIRGQMSLIGPRPEVPEFVDIREERWREVLKVTPGLFDRATVYVTQEAEVLAASTDWQDCYRKVILPVKLECSLLGIRERSLLNDLRLLVKLVTHVMRTVFGISRRKRQ